MLEFGFYQLLRHFCSVHFKLFKLKYPLYFKMMRKIFAVCLFIGVAFADPIKEISSPFSKELGFMSVLLNNESDLATITPTLVLDLISAVVGYKASALAIAVGAIEWLVSKSVIIAIGAILTFGFCKLTDKCNFDYEQYVPLSSIAQFRTLATPERLVRAEQFLVTAVEKYAEKRRSFH